MPPERYDADDPREWIRLARGDLALAEANVPGAPPELLCFHAQQAAEKAIKAVLIHARVAFPHTHDLDRLLDILEENDTAIPGRVRDATALTDYAVRTRYPFLGEPVTAGDLQAAVDIATSIVAWADARVIK
ncbi:MAG: HEPN domain-containing protein [Longimicrobiales bacterium]